MEHHEKVLGPCMQTLRLNGRIQCGTGVDMYVVPNTYSIRFVIHTAGCTLRLLCLIYNNVYATDSSPRDTGAAFGNCTRLPLMIVHDQ